MSGIHSRRWGVAVVAAVLLMLALVPALDPRPVTGVAIAAPVPGPPAIGDCLTEPIDPSWQSIDPPAGAGVSSYAYPRLNIEGCTGARYGEVTGLIVNPVAPVVTTTPDSTTIVDSNLEKCGSDAELFVGKTMAGALPAPVLTYWYFQLTVATVAITPSTRQLAAGEHWLACVGYLHRLSGAIESIAAEEKYSGTIRNALFTGNERNRTSTCTATTDLSGARIGDVQCSSRHQGEVFAYGLGFNHPVSRVALQDTCRTLVRRLTGVADVAAAGLRVDVRALDVGAPDGTAEVVTEATIPAGSFTRCGVVVVDGGRTLDGSLLALGDHPVPWSP